MQAIHRKLVRDLWHIKGQVLAISLVIAAAVTVYVMYLGAFESLRLTQATYYDRYRFADVFASAGRAPLSLEDRIRDIPGVSRVDLRVTSYVTLDMPGLDEPAMAQLVSIPDDRQVMLNDLYIRSGRYIDSSRADEVLVNEGFALAHDLEPGDTITAIINGRRRDLEVAGIALSPEFIYILRPGDIMPDDERYGILWMNRQDLAAAFDMEGGFNNVVLKLMPGTSEEEAISRLDGILDRYGGRGATSRELQASHWFLSNELRQLESFGTVIPIIFLAVAAFLLNVVLGRIITVQREQIAALKALGYSNFEVGLHYYLWALAVTLIGIMIGLASGAWLASAMVNIYNDFFRFPLLAFRIAPNVIATSVAVSLIASMLGARSAVRKAVELPPAEAMRPQAPAHYRVSLIERIGLGRWMSPATRIIIRNLTRRPVRTALSVIGIAFGAAMVVEGMFFMDAMVTTMDIQFSVAQRQDITLTFVQPASPAALYEIGGLEGVMSVEPVRTIPARLRFGHLSRQVAVMGLVSDPRLNRVIDDDLTATYLPPGGLILSRQIAEIIGADEGDMVTMEVMEGRRPVREVPVAAVIDEFLGTSVYMELGTVRDLMREGDVITGAYLTVDSRVIDDLYRRLKNTPAVAAVSLKAAAVESFEETVQQNLGVIIFFNQLFSSVIAFGVIYNAARISLSERSWELASLRVMGFTRNEISYVLLGEFALLAAVAIPIGLLLGYGLAAVTVATVGSTELYRIPLIVGNNTYGQAALSVVAATLISSLVVRRKLNRLDLVSVLKTRE
jgi:putative ABC transport system permease protein